MFYMGGSKSGTKMIHEKGETELSSGMIGNSDSSRVPQRYIFASIKFCVYYILLSAAMSKIFEKKYNEAQLSNLNTVLYC